MTAHKPLALTAATIAAAMALAACSGGASTDPNTIEIGSLYEPVNLSNIAGGGQGVTEALNGNVYEGLFSLADDGTIQPQLATSYDVSEDGLTYTFHLRDGVTFSDGSAFDAADAVHSINRVLADDSQSARKSQLAVINSVEATDPQTLTVTLSQRSISLPYNLSYLWMVPEGFDSQTETDGTGPYTLDARTKGSTLALKARDGYWGDAPKNDAVTFHYYTDATAMTNALSAGDIDIITSLQSPDALATFQGNSDFVVSEGTSTTKELLAFNEAQAPFNDARVRQAIYSAIDREKLLESIWGDAGQVIGSMVPPSDPWYEDLTSVNPYDPERSKSLLAEAGAEGLSFTLDTPSYDPHPTVAEFIKSELAKVGVTVTINTITADEWYSKVYKEHDFQATLQEHVNTRDVVWYGNPTFYWGYNNEAVTALVDEAEQASTEDEQTEKLRAANEQIAADAASAWLYLYPQIVVARSNVSGYGVNGLNSQFVVSGISKN